MRWAARLAAAGLLVTCAAWAQQPSPAEVLRDEFSGQTPDARITALVTFNSAGEQGVVYSLTGWNGEQLKYPIFIARKRNGQWRQFSLPAPEVQALGTTADCLGPVINVDKHKALYYLSLELTPSAECIVILRDDFTTDQTLAGTIEDFFQSGLMLYMGAMVHFADAHPETLWLYDPDKHISTQMYPQPDDPFRAAFSARLQEAMNDEQCRSNNWDCNPMRFTSSIDFPLQVNDQTSSFAFRVQFEPDGFVTNEEAQDSGHWDDDQYVYVYQLSPFRWREFSIYDLKPKFGTDSLKDLIAPGIIDKIFANPAPK